MIKYLKLIILLILFPASLATADDRTWQWSFGPYGDELRIGTNTYASNDCDPSDYQLGSSDYIYIGVYHEQGVDGWTGSNGFYSQEMRAALGTTTGSSKTWRIYYWNNVNSPTSWTDTDFTWHFGSDAYEFPSENIEYKLTFVRMPVGMSEWNPPSSYASPTLGETIILNEHAEGNWVLRTYRTDNGLNGYIFDLTATVVPEPSSIVALVLGLVPVTMSALKRRNRASPGK